jgi:hypothetical protein
MPKHQNVLTYSSVSATKSGKLGNVEETTEFPHRSEVLGLHFSFSIEPAMKDEKQSSLSPDPINSLKKPNQKSHKHPIRPDHTTKTHPCH